MIQSFLGWFNLDIFFFKFIPGRLGNYIFSWIWVSHHIKKKPDLWEISDATYPDDSTHNPSKLVIF